MERYDYLRAVTEDVKQYILDEVDASSQYADREALEEALNDALWAADSVTGNASGSYYCNAYMAEEALAHNWDLLAEALAEFGEDGVDVLRWGAEAMDVTIRCYLLSQAISAALDALEEELTFAEDDEN